MWNAVLIAARLLQFGAALTLFGSSLFYRYGVENPPGPRSTLARWPGSPWLLIAAAALTVIGTVLWVMAETVSFSGDSADALHPTALWTVLGDTRFGRACLARLTLLGLSLAILSAAPRSRAQWWIQGLIGGLVVASFAWTGHGASGRGLTGAAHLGADLLHLWAAGLWLGALPPLVLLTVSSIGTSATAVAPALHYGLIQFSRIGTAVVAALVLSGLVNAWFLIEPARWRSLFDTAYGLALLLKLVLFIGMLALAARHRFGLTPALERAMSATGSPGTLVGRLRSSLVVETALALGVLLAVSLLGTLAPPAATE